MLWLPKLGGCGEEKKKSSTKGRSKAKLALLEKD